MLLKREFGNEVSELLATLPTTEAVIRPIRWSNHNTELDWPWVDCSRNLDCSWVQEMVESFIRDASCFCTQCNTGFSFDPARTCSYLPSRYSSHVILQPCLQASQPLCWCSCSLSLLAHTDCIFV